MKTHLQQIEFQLGKIFNVLSHDPILQNDIDTTLRFLLPHSTAENCGDVKLIIIGQDPTVRNYNSRKDITATLNLDKRNSLRKYICMICNRLQIDLDKEVYATNLYKCFFKHPPADNFSVLTRHFKIWADLLINELNAFSNPIIISLGEPLIKQLIHTGNSNVKYFWDYQGNTKSGNDFKSIEPNDNYLQRRIYPIAHQPSWQQNKFYFYYLDSYLDFIINNSKNK